MTVIQAPIFARKLLAVSCGMFLLLLVTIVAFIDPSLAQENVVESLTISAQGRDDDKTGIGIIEVSFLFSFAQEIKSGDLGSVKISSSGSNLSSAIKKAGRWDYPSKSTMRLIVPLPELMAAGAIFKDNTTSISFQSEINLSSARQQTAQASFDFVALDDVVVKPTLLAGAQVQVKDKNKEVLTSKEEPSVHKDRVVQQDSLMQKDQVRVASASSAVSSNNQVKGIPDDLLPEALARETKLIGPEGGKISLPSGASVSIPSAALAQKAEISVSKVKSHWEDMELYHISPIPAPLSSPAVVSLPLPESPGNEIQAVDVLHFHDLNDPGTLLPNKWQPGDKEVIVETNDFSIIAVIVIRTFFVYLAAREVEIKMLSNTLEMFEAAVAAALKAATNKSVLLPSVAYNQFPPNTMWCWSSSYSALLHTVQPLDKHMADPLKPQSMAGLWKYNRSGYLSTGPSPLEWLSSDGDLFKTLSNRADAPVEIRYFPRYPALAAYIIAQIDQGFPVSVDLHSKTHVVNIVGYDEQGPYAHDPTSLDQPIHTSWKTLFAVLQGKALSFSGNFALTTVIKRDVRSFSQPYAINLPSCEFNAKSSAHTNENGIYFTLPVRGGHAGFMWDGKAERYGMRLVAGQPEGPETQAIENLVVGQSTKVGAKNIEVTNSSSSEIAAEIRLEVFEESSKRSQIILPKKGISLPPRKISRHDLEPIAFLPELRNRFPMSGSLVMRTIVTVGGEDKDLVLTALKYRLFLLTSATATVTNKGTVLELKGSGLSSGEMELTIEIPLKEPQKLVVAAANTDTDLSVPVSLSMEDLREAMVSLRIVKQEAGWMSDANFDRAGLVTEKVNVTTGGRIREVSTADDPERYIAPPPTEPWRRGRDVEK